MNYLYIGKIVNTHGIKGEIKIISNFKFKNKIFLKNNKIYIGKNKIQETINSYRVHKNFDIEQDEYCFDLNNINESVTLLINSKEQIFTEKLKSLLKVGFVSTRYKDIFDFYYLINNENLNKDKLLNILNIYIYSDKNMRENNINDILKRLNRILHNKNYLRNLNTAKNNWLELPIDDVIENVLNFFENTSLTKI